MNILFAGGADFIGSALVRYMAKIKLEEKPRNSISKYASPGLYFTDNLVLGFAKALSPSDRGELEVLDLLKSYFKKQNLTVTVFGRGIRWMNNSQLIIFASFFPNASYVKYLLSLLE